MKTETPPNLLRNLVLAALLTAGAGLTAQTLNSNLLFYVPFNGTLNDAAGGLTGNGFNAPLLHASGGVGGGGYVQLQNDASSPKQAVWYNDPTPATTDFSFQIWVRAADAATAQNGQPDPDAAIAANKDWGSGSNVGWVLAREDGAEGDQFQWNMNTVGGSRRDLDLRNPTATVFDGSWHQLVVTYQRSGNATFYRDGLAIAAASIAADTGSLRPSLGAWVTNNILALGEDATLQYWHGSGSALNADLDEAAMWGRVLTAEDVAAAYAKGTSGIAVSGPLTPAFVQQPQGGTRFTSDNFLLTCLVADDRGPLTYQWYRESGPLTGATTRSFLLTNLTNGNAGNYSVVVNDGVGSLTSAPAALTILSASPITSGLAVYLNFDNNIAAQAGTTVGGTAIGNDPNPKYTAGQVGSAAIFNNDASSPTGWSSDWAVSLGDIEWVYTNNWSFSLWVNLTNNLDGGLLGNKDWTSGGNVGWVFAPYNSVDVNYCAVRGPRQDIGSFNVCDGRWHHVAAVFNRDANLAYVYVDGNLTASASLSFTGWESLTPTTFSPNATLVGSSGDQAYSGAGAIDDLGIWARSLTADEILAIYAQGQAGQPLTTAVAGSAIRPSISAQPQGLTLFEGGKAALSVVAAGSSPLSFQWYKSGALVSGATNSTLVFYPVTTNNAGNYTVVITNRFGSITSSPPAALVVLPITGVTSGLAVYLNLDGNIEAQAGTTNSGTAIGAVASPTYTGGQIGSAALFNNDGSGGTSSDWAVSLGDIEWIYAGNWTFSLWVNATNANDGGLLGNKDWDSGGNVGWVFDPSRSGNGFGSKGFLNWTCAGGPRQDPGGASLMDGLWHHVAAVFDRDANLVTIYVNGNVTGTTNLAVLGAESLTPTTFSPNATLIGSSGPDTWSGAGAVDDVGIWARPLSAQEVLAIFVQGLYNQPLTTASATAMKPLILAQPQSETRLEGLPANFAVTATGSAPLSYQWRKNGVDLAGETNAQVSFPTALSDSGAALTVVVTNPYGSATSSPPALLTVTAGPKAITNGLVVYLNFESNILAQAGTTNSGTAVGTVGIPKYEAGIVGNWAARFDNDDSDAASASDWAVSLGDIEWLYAGNWSFSVWVKTTDNYGGLLGNKSWYSGGNIGWVISEYYTDWLNYRAVNSPRHDIGNFNWADGLWHNVAAVFYRDANVVYTYADGTLTAQAALSVTGAESLTPTDIVTTLIGSSGNGAESAYGDIDDLGMWTRPLTEAEILGIYQAGLGAKGIPQAAFPAPLLSVAASGKSIILTYPGWAKGYTLESSPNLSPGSWTTVAAAPTTVGTNTVVTLTPAADIMFVRGRIGHTAP